MKDIVEFAINGKDLEELHLRARVTIKKLIGQFDGTYIHHLIDICPNEVVIDDQGRSQIVDWIATVRATINIPKIAEEVGKEGNERGRASR